MCVLPKASDRLGSDRSPHLKLAHTRRKLLRVLLLVLDQCLYGAFCEIILVVSSTTRRWQHHTASIAPP